MEHAVYARQAMNDDNTIYITPPTIFYRNHMQNSVKSLLSGAPFKNMV